MEFPGKEIPNIQCCLLIFYGRVLMKPDENNYANDELEILYRLYV